MLRCVKLNLGEYMELELVVKIAIVINTIAQLFDIIYRPYFMNRKE